MTLRADEHNHSFALEVRYIFGFAVLFQVGREACQKELTLLFEHDRASAEEDIRLHFVSVLEELDGMFELEVIIVVVRLGSETNLLNLLLLLVGFRLFLLFLLRVQELLIVDDPADRGSRRRSYLDEVEILVISYFHSLLIRVDALLYIIADKAHLLDTAYLVVDTMGILFNNSTAARSLRNSSYCFTNLTVNIVLLAADTNCPTIEKACKITINF